MLSDETSEKTDIQKCTIAGPEQKGTPGSCGKNKITHIDESTGMPPIKYGLPQKDPVESSSNEEVESSNVSIPSSSGDPPNQMKQPKSNNGIQYYKNGTWEFHKNLIKMFKKLDLPQYRGENAKLLDTSFLDKKPRYGKRGRRNCDPEDGIERPLPDIRLPDAMDKTLRERYKDVFRYLPFTDFEYDEYMTQKPEGQKKRTNDTQGPYLTKLKCGNLPAEYIHPNYDVLFKSESFAKLFNYDDITTFSVRHDKATGRTKFVFHDEEPSEKKQSKNCEKKSKSKNSACKSEKKVANELNQFSDTVSPQVKVSPEDQIFLDKYKSIIGDRRLKIELKRLTAAEIQQYKRKGKVVKGKRVIRAVKGKRVITAVKAKRVSSPKKSELPQGAVINNCVLRVCIDKLPAEKLYD